MTDEYQEYNATIADLKIGTFFKLYPEGDLLISLTKRDGVLEYLEIGDDNIYTYPLNLTRKVIIIPTKDVIKKAYRHDW